MKLNKLLKGIRFVEYNCDKETEINDIVFNSKQVKIGDMFICLKGVNTDGHDYVLEAVKNGASLIVSEKFLGEQINHIVVNNTRQAFSVISANFYNNCVNKLKLIGITGTNGKTTSSIIIRNILMKAGKNVGVIGTLGYFINKENFECDLTTPDPLKLHSIFEKMYNNNVEYVVMEVSAHAIALEKIYGLEFEVGALSNITQDHLDFFKSMDNYIKTKFKFMTSPYVKTKILNADDKSVHFLEDELTFSYGINQPADCFAMDISLKMGESKYLLNLFDNVIEINTKLSGEFNVYNALLASTVCCVLGINVQFIKTALEEMQPVDGRYNVINTVKGSIVIDFAHTPDGLENILKSLRQNCKNLICVFGCGGNRDSKKRPLMGEIVEKYSDVGIITTDNPRFENPDLIAEDILEGIENKDKFIIENDRKKAIRLAIDKLEDNSIVAVCGKGGEKYQDINGIMNPFNDNEVVEQILEELDINIIN